MPDLSGFPVLDVAIGLFFLYFLLSTISSWINEAIANLLGWRAKTLEDAIRNLVDDPKVKRGLKEWVGGVHKKGLKKGSAVESKRDDVTVAADLTSELFDHWRIKALVRDPESSIRRRTRPSYLPPRAFSLAIAETLAKGAPKSKEGPTPWQQADEDILAGVNDVLGKLPKGQARAVLQKAAANAGSTLDGFRAQVEHAFDDAMQRASGWYKRKVQVMVLILAAAVAIGGNVDSVRIANRLWNDAPVRAAVAAKAVDQPDSQEVANAVDTVDQLQLPLGWGAANAPKGVGEAAQRIPGWLITIAALSLGAPFWFDLLSRLVRLRGSGVPERPRSMSDATGTGRTGPTPRD
ncbi:MAG: hypothetical protein H0U12_00130 [Thermoleophilaceae bacterium]|nr:hypothetical protein [Thermoleophilaceae bacterium]